MDKNDWIFVLAVAFSAFSAFFGVLFAVVLASHILTWDVRISEPMQIEAVDAGSGEIQRADAGLTAG